MVALLGSKPYRKAEARTQAAEVYEDSTGAPVYRSSPVAVRGFPRATPPQGYSSRRSGMQAVKKVFLN